MKPVRRVIQELLNHDKSIYIKVGFSWNKNTANIIRKAKDKFSFVEFSKYI